MASKYAHVHLESYKPCRKVCVYGDSFRKRFCRRPPPRGQTDHGHPWPPIRSSGGHPSQDQATGTCYHKDNIISWEHIQVGKSKLWKRAFTMKSCPGLASSGSDHLKHMLYLVKHWNIYHSTVIEITDRGLFYIFHSTATSSPWCLPCKTFPAMQNIVIIIVLHWCYWLISPPEGLWIHWSLHSRRCMISWDKYIN